LESNEVEASLLRCDNVLDTRTFDKTGEAIQESTPLVRAPFFKGSRVEDNDTIPLIK
jgi:hypothetical protein